VATHSEASRASARLNILPKDILERLIRSFLDDNDLFDDFAEHMIKEDLLLSDEVYYSKK